MKKFLILTTMLFPIAAFALGDNTNTNSNTATNNTTNNNATSSSSSATNHNSNVNHNSQHQAQGQNQSTSSNANGANSNDISYNNNNPRNPVASAWAAPLTAGAETCMGSSSIGGQGVGLGLSVGSTWHDEGCERRHDATMLHNFGEHRAAMALMCQDENIRKAMSAVGHSCPTDAKTAEAKEDSTTVVKKVTVTNSYPTQPRK